MLARTAGWRGRIGRVKGRKGVVHVQGKGGEGNGWDGRAGLSHSVRKASEGGYVVLVLEYSYSVPFFYTLSAAW